jgi:hypothetical protein
VSRTTGLAREGVLAALAGVLLAVAMTWPLALHLGSDIGKDLGDPLLQTWQVAWIGHTLLEAPLDLWQANTFWPYDDTLAFSDALVGYAPAGLVAQAGPHAALVVYNLLFLSAYALAFVGAYLLGRELGLGVLGASAAGAAFAYAPWRLAQNGHLHVLSSGGIPLALFFLVRGYHRESPWLVLAGWAVASWQMTLGFTLGLQLAYLLGVLALLALLAFLRGWLPRPDRRVVLATVVGGALFLLAASLMARPYLRVLDAHPEARRTPDYVATFSPDLQSFFVAPEQSWLWADATSYPRAALDTPDETSLFPGLTTSVLALVGVLGSVFPRRLRIGLVAAVAVCALLSLGLRDVSGPQKYLTPFRLLYDFAPGWDGVRTPGRINTLTSLGLALLAGAGLCVVVRWVRGRRGARAAAAIGAALAAAILVEGLGPLAHPRVPTPPEAVLAAPAPQLHLPAGFHDDLVYSYYSTAGFPKTVNGAGGFDPTGYDRLRREIAGFPDRDSVETLRKSGIHSVLLHTDRAAGTPWERAANRSVDGLPLDRQVIDGVVLFRLR